MILLNNKRVVWKTDLIFFCIGLFGLFTILPTLRPWVVQLKNLPAAPNISENALLLLTLVNPLILLIMGIVMGTFLAPQLGLQSHIETSIRTKTSFRALIQPHLIPSIVTGTLLGLLIFLLDFLFQPWIPKSLHFTTEARDFLTTISGIFYGGIVEELICRWGFMTLLIWFGWRFLQKRQGEPKKKIIWYSIFLTAIVFALGHLGSVSIIAPLTLSIFLRTLLLNGFIGVVLGWIFWKRGLESAMIVHAFFHISLSLVVYITI